MKVDLRHSDEQEHRFKIASSVNQLYDGKSDNHGTFTLTANQATTTVSDLRAGVDSKIFYTPTTANASAEVGNGTIYISAKGKESFTVTHANNAQSDRTFDYMIVG